MAIESSLLVAMLSLSQAPPSPATSDAAAIAGLVRDNGAQPLRGALVVAHCDCLPRPREVQTDDSGRFRLEGLPPGEYTVQVLFGAAEVLERVALERAIRRALYVRVDTRADMRRDSGVDPGRGEGPPRAGGVDGWTRAWLR